MWTEYETYQLTGALSSNYAYWIIQLQKSMSLVSNCEPIHGSCCPGIRTLTYKRYLVADYRRMLKVHRILY